MPDWRPIGVSCFSFQRVQHGVIRSGFVGLPGETPRDGLRGAGSGQRIRQKAESTKHCVLSYAWKLMYDVCMMILWG